VDACEWRRPLGRPARQVRVDAVLSSPSEAAAGRPVLHTYWSGCVDVDTWRTTEKDSVDKWVRSLHAAAEWLLVLPTPKVTDKAKADLKTTERCIFVKDPSLLRRVRLLLLSAVNTEEQHLGQEVRRERESRNEAGWSFGEYLALQEKLASLLGALKGVEDEALVQYDELDALFTQFVRNASLTGNYF
jgi:trafficking protein particle complex subunit 10